MVKLGPKLPLPTRRELARIEKEQKRLAQLESGINLATIGEPREHLMYLLSTSKRARAKQPDSLAMEESKRRREKTQKRAVARRAAKNMMKEIIACVTQGSKSKAHGDCARDDFHVGVDDAHRTPVSEVPATPIIRPITFVEPWTITDLPALPGPGQETDKHSPSPTPEKSTSTSSVANLLDAIILEAAQTLNEDDTWKSLLGTSATERLTPDHSAKISDVDKEIHCLEVQISTETDTFWDEDTFTSATAPVTAVNPQMTEEIEAISQPAVMSPERHRATLTSQILPPIRSRRSSLRGSNFFDPTAGSASQAPPRTRSVSKSVIFSEPLDYSKYSSKPSSTQSSVRSQYPSTPAYQFSRAEHRMEGLDRPDTPIPDDYERLSSPSGSRLPAPSNVRLASRVPSGVPMGPRAAPMPNSYSPHGWTLCDALTNSPETAEKPRFAGLSADGVALERPYAIPQLSVPATHVSTSIVEGVANDCPPNAPVDSILSPIVDNKLPDIVRLGGLAIPFGANYTRAGLEKAQSLSQFNSSGSGQTPISAQLITPNHIKAYQDDSVQVVNSTSFSSNMSSPRGSDNNPSITPVPFSTAIMRDVRQHLGTTSAYYSPTSISPSSPTIRPLAPAASIIQDKKVRSGNLAERNSNIRRIATLDDLEKGTSDINSRESCAVTERTISFGRHRAFQQDDGSHQDTLACPDTPLGDRSGIVPPASTPVSRSPLIFAIALPVAPWSRAAILPTHGPHVADRSGDGGGMKGIVSALKWALKKTFGYFWQRRR